MSLAQLVSVVETSPKLQSASIKQKTGFFCKLVARNKSICTGDIVSFCLQPPSRPSLLPFHVALLASVSPACFISSVHLRPLIIDGALNALALSLFQHILCALVRHNITVTSLLQLHGETIQGKLLSVDTWKKSTKAALISLWTAFPLACDACLVAVTPSLVRWLLVFDKEPGVNDRIIALVERAWKQEDVILRSMEVLFSLLVATGNKDDNVVPLARLVARLPVQLTPIVSSFVATAMRQFRSSSGGWGERLFHRILTQWPLRGSVAAWICAIIQGCCDVQKFSLLSSVTALHGLDLTKKVLLGASDVDPQGFRVLSRLLAGFQHSPTVFHTVLPVFCTFLREHPHSPLRPKVSQLLHCLLHQFAGFPALYQEPLQLLDSLQERAPPLAARRAFLAQNEWRQQENGDDEKRGGDNKRLVGLANFGNTCYLNSVVQILFLNDELRDLLLKRRCLSATANMVESMYGSYSVDLLLRELQLVFAFLLLSKRPFLEGPIESFLTVMPLVFRNRSQQDAGEFSKFITECVRDHTPHKLLFQGVLDSRVECLTCHSVSTRQEDFTQLNLSLVGDAQVETLIEEYFAAETLGGDNAYMCTTCAQKRIATKRLICSTLPRFLCVCLKRFSAQQSKLLHTVSFEERLVMGDIPYVLYGVVIHAGATGQYGHYYAIARHSNDAVLGGGGDETTDWFCLNDASVTCCSWDSIKSRLGGMACAYLLFYRRASDQDKADIEKAQTIPSETAADVAARVNADNERFMQEREHIIATNGEGNGGSSGSGGGDKGVKKMKATDFFALYNDYEDPNE